MHRAIAHHLMTNAQPIPKQCQPPQPTPLSFTAFLHDVTRYGRSFGQFRSAALFLSPLSFLCPTPSSLTGRTVQQAEKTAKQHLEHLCVINIVFLLKPRHSIIPDTMKEKKKINTQFKLGQECTQYRIKRLIALP